MTILPKKKHNEAKKGETDYDTRVRARSSRERNRNPEDLTSDICSGGNTTSPKCECTDTRKSHFDSTDSGTSSYKRSRHRAAASNAYHMGGAEKSRGSYRRQTEEDVEETGYNSSDEYGPQEYDPDLEQKEKQFESHLQEKKGFIIKKMAQDGACLFRAVADQIYGDQEMHSQVRGHCMDYMVKNADYFSQYITEDFTSYITRKRDDSCHGNHPELQALSEIYNRPIEVYQYSVEPINTFWNSSSCSSKDNPPIRLSYHGNVHYNSVVDPYNATIGVGLGLAGYKPGLADNMMISSAKTVSEQHLIEEEMLEDKRKATDWEATDEEMTEQIARESYLEWLRETQKRHPAAALPGPSSSKPSTSSQSKRSPPRDPSSPSPSASHSAKQLKSSSPPRRRSPSPAVNKKRDDVDYRFRSDRSAEAGSAAGATLQWDDFRMEYLSEGALGNLEEDQILAAVLAESQKEYFESMSRERNIKEGDETG